MVPYIRNSTDLIYPLNDPAWSLLAELIANVVHAFFLRRQSSRSLAVWILGCAVLLVGIIYWHGSVDVGTRGYTSVLLVVRVLFSYITGMLLERWWAKGTHRLNVRAVLPCLILLLMLMVPMTHHLGILFDIPAVLLLLPALMMISSHATAGRLLRTPAHLLAQLSYPLYILHVPLYYLFILLALRGNPDNVATIPHSILLWCVYLLVVIGFSFFAEYAYDRPVRSFLRARLRA